MDWVDIPEDIRNAVLFTLQCDASDAEACACNRPDKRCRKMAVGYSAAIELLMSVEK